MTLFQIALVAVAAVAVLAAVAAFAIAYRREGGTEGWRERMPRRAKAADRSQPSAPVVTVDEVPEAEPVEEQVEAVETAPVAVAIAVQEVERKVEATPEQMGVTRRQFFNRALAGTFFAFLGGMTLSMVAFMWPKIRGGFGADIDAGPVQDVKDAIFQPDGTIVPLFVPEARAYVIPFPDELVAESQFLPSKILGFEVVADGLTALFQRCVHLGCRVPWCNPSQGFECPCHGSRYNSVGEYEGGPAPRNLDRFAVEVSETGRFIIKTGDLVVTPRAQTKTVTYPQGASCLAIGAEEEAAEGESS